MAGQLTDILKDAMARSDALERENAALKDRLAAIEGERRAHGMLCNLPDILSVQEVASFLRVKPQHVREMCHSGILPPVLGGGACGAHIRIWKRDLEAYIDSRTARRMEMDADGGNVVPMVITNRRRKKRTTA